MEEAEPPSLKERFEEAEAYYLAIGMPSSEYWNGEPGRINAYIKAHDLARMQKNQELWMQGLYFYNALTEALQGFAIGLNGGKGKKPKGYISDPIPITEAEKEYAKQKRIQHTLEWVAKGQNGNDRHIRA